MRHWLVLDISCFAISDRTFATLRLSWYIKNNHERDMKYSVVLNAMQCKMYLRHRFSSIGHEDQKLGLLSKHIACDEQKFLAN